jgi:hypothetical protein
LLQLPQTRNQEPAHGIPEQVVVEGAGIGEVNGVYKRSGINGGAPKYEMKGRLNGKDEVFELYRESYWWWIKARLYCTKSAFRVSLHVFVYTHYLQTLFDECLSCKLLLNRGENLVLV